MNSSDAPEWQGFSFNLAPLKALQEPLSVVLSALQALEAILEALVDLLKAFGIFLTNPISAVIALLLAAVRSIIAQLSSAGFSALFILPDYFRSDISSIFASISGGYSAFENKLVYKLRDTTDVNRPSYPEGSAVASFILYLSGKDPSEIYELINNMLALFKGGVNVDANLPAPIDLKVFPVAQSTDPYATFLTAGEILVNTFATYENAKFKKSLALEWRMPSASSALNSPGIVNQSISFYNSYRFPYFIVERSEYPTGKSINIPISTSTEGEAVNAIRKRYGLNPGINGEDLKDSDGTSAFRFFENKRSITTFNYVTGIITDVYRYVDTEVEYGKTYYYRVRAYFGSSINTYINSTESDYTYPGSLVKLDRNNYIINYGFSAGRSSAVATGVAPFPIATFWNPSSALYDAVLVGILLNFELPSAASDDPTYSSIQKTGWGTLNQLGGFIGPIKGAAGNSETLLSISGTVLFPIIKGYVNKVISGIINNPFLNKTVLDKYQIIAEKIQKTLIAKVKWTFPKISMGNISSGFTETTKAAIGSYLSAEPTYVKGQLVFNGPYPTYPWTAQDSNGLDVSSWTAEERYQLANLLSIAFSSVSTNAGYLRWYTLTLGDFFPAFISFLFDLDQFISSVLSCLKNALEEITNTVVTFLNKIRQLEEILASIISIADLFTIELSASILTYSESDSSVDKLTNAIVSSTNKPTDPESSLHSGLILTVGGPGEGVSKAFDAIKFVLGA